MLNLLKNILKSFFLPCSLMVLSKFFGLIISFSIFNIYPTVNNYTKGIFSFSFELSNSSDIIISNSTANIFMLLVTGIYFYICLNISKRNNSLFNNQSPISQDYPSISLKYLNLKSLSVISAFLIFFISLSISIIESINQSASIFLGFISIILIFYSTRIMINTFQTKFDKVVENAILS